MVAKQFPFTKESCEKIEKAIRFHFPDIQGLTVGPDMERNEILVVCEDERYTKEEIEAVINSIK